MTSVFWSRATRPDEGVEIGSSDQGSLLGTQEILLGFFQEKSKLREASGRS